MWYKEWFSSSYYLDIYRHRDEEDARNLVNLIQRTVSIDTHSKALDIACGAGRHSLELARRGFDVTGLDLSGYLISEARRISRKAPEKNLMLKFLIKDMRHFNFKKEFTLAVNLFTSFGYFDRDEENFSVIKNASDSLKKGGYFVLDFINKDYLKENIVGRSRNVSGDEIVIQKRRIEGDFVIKDIKIKKKSNEQNYQEILKLYSYAKLKKAFESYNLKVVHTFGDYFGSPFISKKSKRLIIFGKKA